MKRAALVIVVIAVTLTIMVSASFDVRTAQATSSQEYVVKRINHKIEVLYDGNIILTDTIQLVGNSTDETATLESFRIGFPYNYSQYILRQIAYDSSNNSFQINSNIPFEGHMGFYAVEAVFPQPLSIWTNTTHIFTVEFILSNDLCEREVVSNYTYYYLNFPAYPSLTETVALCNVSMVFPGSAQYVSGTLANFSYSKNDLPAFTYLPATVKFTLIDSTIDIVNMEELKREITIDELGQIKGSDTYRMLNKAQDQLFSINVILPQNASNVQAEDQFGRKMATPILSNASTNSYTINFTLILAKGNSSIFTLNYDMPSSVYIKQQGTTDSFNLTFPLFQKLNYLIGYTSVTFTLPEGARLQSFEKTSNASVSSLTKGVFQDTLIVTEQNCLVLDSFEVKITYAYNSLWLAFRPALWMWGIALIGCVVVVVWRKPEAKKHIPAPSMAVKLQPEHLQAFAKDYEEKMKIIAELDSLEVKVQKGKIPRRRYKVQKKTLETRLNTLSRTLTEHKEQLRAAGGHYSELVLQLEIAESQIKEVDTSVKNLETQYNRGELSLEAYRKRLDDYQHRKENAEATINGILLRFREEIR
jgi:hypothetical protein